MTSNNNLTCNPNNHNSNNHENVNIPCLNRFRNGQLAEKLNVVSDATQAARYEEFLANISRRYIENCTEVLIEEILEHAQKRSNGEIDVVFVVYRKNIW